MTSTAATQSAINIPTIQFTNPEKAALATALALLVAGQVFPQLSTSFGWVCECGPTSLVLGTALAGATLNRSHERHSRQMSEVRTQIRTLQEELKTAPVPIPESPKQNNTVKAHAEDRRSTRIQELENKIAELNQRIKETEKTKNAEIFETRIKSLIVNNQAKDDLVQELQTQISEAEAKLSEVVQSSKKSSAAQAQLIKQLEEELKHHSTQHELNSSRASLTDTIKNNQIKELEDQIVKLKNELAGLADTDISTQLQQEFANTESNFDHILDDIHLQLDQMFAVVNDEQAVSITSSPQGPFQQYAERIKGWVERVKAHMVQYVKLQEKYRDQVAELETLRKNPSQKPENSVVIGTETKPMALEGGVSEKPENSIVNDTWDNGSTEDEQE